MNTDYQNLDVSTLMSILEAKKNEAKKITL